MSWAVLAVEYKKEKKIIHLYQVETKERGIPLQA